MRKEGGRFEVTALGRLAGESGAEVSSIVRLVECLGPLQSAQITDPTLIAAVRSTVELDGVYVPINKKTAKEAQSWVGMLRDQGVAEHVLRGMRREVAQAHDAGARAKRAVAALAYIAGQVMEDIEALLGRHGGGFDGSAGPVRSIAGRTCDLIGTAGRVAELLHPDVKVEARVQRLALRLTLGIPGPAVELGRELSASLSRGDYLRLVSFGLSDAARIVTASDGELLACVDSDMDRLRLLRSAADAILQRQKTGQELGPTLAPYAA
jgi:helicase